MAANTADDRCDRPQHHQDVRLEGSVTGHWFRYPPIFRLVWRASARDKSSDAARAVGRKSLPELRKRAGVNARADLAHQL